MNWKERIAAKQAELSELQASISPEEQEEIEARATLEKLDAQIEEQKRQKRELDLARRFDAAREEHGEGAHMEALSFEDREDTFVVKHNGKANATWIRKLNAPQKGGKAIDVNPINVEYAVAVVIDWNGIPEKDLESTTSAAGGALRRYLSENLGIANAIVNVASRLAGAHAESKSR